VRPHHQVHEDVSQDQQEHLPKIGRLQVVAHFKYPRYALGVCVKPRSLIVECVK
jgi:hypothetical protein